MASRSRETSANLAGSSLGAQRTGSTRAAFPNLRLWTCPKRLHARDAILYPGPQMLMVIVALLMFNRDLDLTRQELG